MTGARTRRAGGFLAALAACAPFLSACGNADALAPVAGTNWQITDLYLTPEAPSALPDLIAGRAALVFGERSVAGSTGCAPVQGQVTFTSDGAESAAADADRVSFDNVQIGEPAEDCVGRAMFTHRQLSELLDGQFELARLSDYELALTKVSDEIDAPAIHLSSNTLPEQPAE